LPLLQKRINLRWSGERIICAVVPKGNSHDYGAGYFRVNQYINAMTCKRKSGMIAVGILLLAITVVNAQQVGMTKRDFADSSRQNWAGTGPRVMRTVIWYPSAGEGTDTVLDKPGQFTAPVTVVKDGAIAISSKKYPLIMVSHGANGNTMQMAWLGYYLAAHGYVVAAVEHSGSPAEERNYQSPTISESCIWELPRDISAVLSQIETDAFLGKNIDTSRVGVAGFSLGGAVAIWTAGAVLSLPALSKDTFIPEELKANINKMRALQTTDPMLVASKKHAEDNFKDNRIKAVFVLAPAIARGFPAATLNKISVPVRIVVGDADLVTPATANAEVYAQNIKGAKLTVLPAEAGHFIRNHNAAAQAKIFEQVNQLAAAFLGEVL
jgi:predicted dienelactone hydrolase